MNEEKKKWEIPKLICLYRGRPEEAVLANCKGDLANGPSGWNKCRRGQDVCIVRNTT